MEKSSKPIFQTTTDEGTTIKIDANLPSLSSLKEQTEKAAENFPPSNAQIEENLESAKETLEKGKKEGNLNERGQTLVKDVEKLIDTTATALEEKNKDDKLQKLYADTKEAVDKAAPILKKEAQKEGKKIQKKGEEIQKKGEKIGKEAKSKLEKAGKEAKSDLKEQSLELKDDAQELYSYIKNLLWNFLRSEDFRELAADWVGFLQFLGTKNLKEKAKEQEGKGGVTGNVAKAVDQGLEQTSKPADQDELQKRTEDMFQDLVNRIRSKPEYQNAFRDMFKLWDQFQAKFDSISKEVKKEVKEVKKEVKKEAKKVKEEVKKEAKKESDKVSEEVDTDPFWKAARDAEDVVESFTGKSEWKQFKKSFKSAYNSVKDDSDLRKWISDLRSFFDAIFENPEGVTDEAYQKRAKELTTRGRQLLQKKKWRNQFNKIYENFNVLLDRIKNDTTTNEFGERLKQLGRDFALNEKGYPDLFVMEDSLIQVKNLLIPLFKQQLENINIGRIDFINDTYDVRIEDLGFSGSFLPEHIDFAMRNDSHLDTKDSSKDSMRHMLTFQVDKIKPEFKNFKFYYRRKTFPKIEDYGVADMKVSGNGGLIRVSWRVDSKSGSKPVATLTGVTVYIDRLDLHIVGEKTKHDVLDKMLVPLVTKTIKNKISSSLEDFLRSKLTEANVQLNKFLQSSPVDTIKQKANEAMQGGLEKANVQLKDFLESAPLDTLKQKASEGLERMQGSMEKANEKLQSGVEKASDKVQEGLEKAQDTVQEGYKKAQEQKSVGAV